MSKPVLTSQLISNSFGFQVVSKARTAIERHNVLNWGFDITCAKILGRVAEYSRVNPYQVVVQLSDPDEAGNRWLTGQCSCPVGRDCVHAAAVALMASNDRDLGGVDLRPGDGSDDTGGNFASIEAQAQPPETVQSYAIDNLVDEAESDFPKFASYWLNRLDGSLGGSSAENGSEDCIIYVLGFDRWTGDLQVEPRIARRLKGGGLGSNRPHNWRQLASSRARMVQASDHAVAKLWVSCSPPDAIISPSRPLPPPFDGDVLDLLLARIIASGRGYFGSMLDRPLKLGAPREGRVEWVVHEDSHQTPQVVLVEKSAGVLVLKGSSHWYTDTNSGESGPIKLPYTRETTEALLAAPRVGPKQTALIGKILSEKMQDLPLPQIDIIDEVREERPLVRLHLKYEKFRHKRLVSDGSRQKMIEGDNIAILTFDYGFSSTKISSDWETYRWSDGKRFIISKRDLDFEKSVRDRLTNLSFVRPSGVKLPPNQSPWSMRHYSPEAWLRFVQETVPLLRQEGWQIESDDNFEYQVVEADGNWLIDIDEGSNFWFNLDLGIIVGGKRISLLPIIVAAIRASDLELSLASLDKLNVGGKFYAGLADGRRVALPFERVKEMLSCLIEVLSNNSLSADGRLGISIPQAAALARIESASHYDWQGARSVRSMVEEMSKYDVLQKIESPATLNAVLRPYQMEGLGWLDFISKFELGGILADDMGLGKTVQALAHIARLKEQGKMENLPCLVVCPTSVLPNWLMEIERLTPSLTAVALHGPDRSSRFELVQSTDIVLTTYPLLVRDAAFLTAQKWHCVLLDEAQAIKNVSTQAAQTVLRLASRYRLCLTGTPIENHLGELWSQFNFLMPGLLGNKATFDRVFKTPIETGSSSEKSARLQLLLSRLKPFILRRTKGQVAMDLPAKVEMVKYIELAGRQRDLYETVRLSMHKHVLDEIRKKGLASCGLIILDALLKLRQTCCHPGLVKLAAAEGIEESAKLQYLMEMLEELLEEKRQILLFSQFTSMLDLIAGELTQRGVDFVQLRGDTKDRAAPVKKFQKGQVQIFLISLKAGGTGLNLTAADTVIHYDPWWNPAVEDQASDRAHRIGQDKPVFIYRLIASGTIEDRMLELQKTKRSIAESILGTGDAGDNRGLSPLKQLDDSALAALFAPLA